MTDVIIVGAGPVGVTVAIGLSRQGYRVTVLEARPGLRADDRRTLALAEGSRRILAEWALWPDRQVTPIDEIHVSQRGRWGQTRLTASEMNLPSLGYVLRYNTLMDRMAEVLETAPVRVVTGAEVVSVSPDEPRARVTWRGSDGEHSESAALVVLADGGRALTADTFGPPRESPYIQVALVAQVRCDRPHHGRAFERFTPQGPIALLPMEDRYALVWTGSRAETEARVAWDETAFLGTLQAVFGYRAGRFLEVMSRSWFPLTLKVVEKVTRAHVLCVGNAAQTMHPVAGQGLNLGLRDALALCDSAQAVTLDTLGSAGMLADYVGRRVRDRTWGIRLTHGLVTGFSNDWPLVTQLRGLGLTGMDLFPASRRALAQVMIFGFGAGGGR